LISQAHEYIERDGWRLTLVLPARIRKLRDRLIKFTIATASGRIVEPMRYSRYARTFQTQFAVAADASAKLFVKVIEPPSHKKRLKRAFRGSPTRHVARITGELASVGISTPAVWIYGDEIATGRELLVTPRADGNGPLHTLAGLVGEITTKRVILRALGEEIARLHRAGFVHGDLTPFNIFIVRGVSPRFVLLDHERTRRSFIVGRSHRQLRNLVQLGRFALPGLSRTDRLRTLSAYVATMGSRDRRVLVRRINEMLEDRIRRDGGLQQVTPLTSSMIHSKAIV
jgi:hypothetical protein